jgi:hypothetical protein
MRQATLLVLTLILGACAYMPTNVSQVQMTGRNGGAVYHGAITREGPAIVSMTVEIERRVYGGNLELTRPNATFGLYQRYGSSDAAPNTAAIIERTNYTRAILSSTDNRILNCDFTDVGGARAGGLCVDDANRVYDVVLS